MKIWMKNCRKQNTKNIKVLLEKIIDTEKEIRKIKKIIYLQYLTTKSSIKLDLIKHSRCLMKNMGGSRHKMAIQIMAKLFQRVISFRTWPKWWILKLITKITVNKNLQYQSILWLRICYLQKNYGAPVKQLATSKVHL